MSEQHSNLRRRFDLRPLRVDAEVILVDALGTEVCRMNESAFAIWQLCDGATSADEISAAVSDAAGLDFPTATREVAAALEELQRTGALT